jgi:hypothetical protein
MRTNTPTINDQPGAAIVGHSDGARVLWRNVHEPPAVIEVNSPRFARRGLYGVPVGDAGRLRIVPGRRVEFAAWGTHVVARGVVTAIVSAAVAYAEIGGKPCGGVNDVWFRWEDAA